MHYVYSCPYYYNNIVRANPEVFVDPYLAYRYFYELQREDSLENPQEYGYGSYHKKSVNSILRIFLIRRRDVLALIEAYGVPRAVSISITRRIIIFVLKNEDKVKGNLNEKVRKLFNKFIKNNQKVIMILRLFGVPQPIIRRYIRRVIRVTLRNI